MSADLSASDTDRGAALLDAAPRPLVEAVAEPVVQQVVDLDARAVETTVLAGDALVLRRVVVVTADDSAVRHGCGAVLPSYFAGHRPRCPRCGRTA